MSSILLAKFGKWKAFATSCSIGCHQQPSPHPPPGCVYDLSYTTWSPLVCWLFRHALIGLRCNVRPCWLTSTLVQVSILVLMRINSCSEMTYLAKNGLLTLLKSYSGQLNNTLLNHWIIVVGLRASYFEIVIFNVMLLYCVLRTSWYYGKRPSVGAVSSYLWYYGVHHIRGLVGRGGCFFHKWTTSKALSLVLKLSIHILGKW